MSGWTVATVHGKEQDQINEELAEVYDGEQIPSSGGYAERAVQFHRGANHYGVAETIVEDLETEIDYIIVVSANDTSDSGYGDLYKIEGDTVKGMDSFDGYEGARGNDVTGYFREEYNLSSYSSWEA